MAVLTLATGEAVAKTGLIAFVGMAFPHLVRSIVKTTNGCVLVLSVLRDSQLLIALPR